MKSTQIIKTTCAAALAALLLSGCEDVANTNFGTGTVSIAIKDAPVDGASAVVVSFSEIALKAYNGEITTVTFDPPRAIDLLQLQGKDSTLLVDTKTVTGGTYSWIRLKVDESLSYLDNSQGRHNLTIPSGEESGLKLVNSFTVPQDGAINLTIDFDLRKSVLEPGNNSTAYKLKPVLRLVQDDKAGHISGTVPSSTVTGCNPSIPAIYLFEGSNVTVDDLDGNDADPIDSSRIKLNTSSGDYEYEIGFLNAGNYTIAFTCQANLDNPETDDATVTFSNTTNVTVTADTTTTHDF